MAADELDELYEVKPEEFTALRTKLAAAAKKRGDDAAAKRIGAARKPTTAAWVVNRLAHHNPDAKASLVDLGERLRAAHTSMDGATIRQLSAEQRKLVDELTRAALNGAELTNPSATLREDVTSTLQAAIADPDVADRLGRLTKAEQWSGFGDFGASAAVSTATRGGGAKTKAKPKPEKAARNTAENEPPQDDTKQQAAREHERAVQEAKAALSEAERAKDDTDGELSDRQTDLAVARLRRDEMRQRLEEAERALREADEAYSAAKQASRDAAEAVKAAKDRLARTKRAK